MSAQAQMTEILIEELKSSPRELVKEVYDYFEFLKLKLLKQEQQSFSLLSEHVFQDIWDNEEDAVYDKFLQEV